MLEQVKSRLISLQAVVDQLQLGADGKQALELESNLNQILLNMALFEQSGQNDEKKRKAIALMREHIHQVNEKLDTLQTSAAEEYRKRIGHSKDSFEKLTNTQQKQENPVAFEYFSTFHLLGQMADMLSLLSSVLMDASGELEKRVRAAKPDPAPDTTPVERYDRDPAPHRVNLPRM
jgi:hypothetical protein